MYGGPLASSSGLLSTDTVRGVVGYCIPFYLVRKNKSCIPVSAAHRLPYPLRFPLKPNPSYLAFEAQDRHHPALSNSLLLWILTMASSDTTLVNEMIEETENCCLEDFSIQVVPDLESAKDTIAKTVVGRLFSKKMISHGTLRKTLTGMWKLRLGWRLQSPESKILVFRLNSNREVKYVLENGPWNPCGGFLLVTRLPEDGRWESADLTKLDIWVKAKGVPLPYLTDECLAQMANRMGPLLNANKVRRNGVVVNDYLRFQVRLDLNRPLLAGVSLPELGQKKIWSYFKYERLSIFCYKCGVIGHLEDDCSGLKRLVAANNGRSIPLFGPWLKDGSRLENGFALLEVEEIQDINRLEKDDTSAGVSDLPGAAPAAIPEEAANPPQEKIPGNIQNPGGDDVAVGHVGRTRVEQVGMEGVVSQKRDNEFNVAYNDYVEMAHFPSKHVIHVANLFKEKLGPIKFGANREEVGLNGSKSGPSNKLKKPRLIGPRGIPRPSLFGRKPTPLGQCSGAKRKKTLHDTTKIDPFVDESDGLSCLVGVDKSGIKDVFAEESGVNHLELSNSSEGYIDPNKKSRLLINSLRSNEGSFGFTKEQGGEVNGKPPSADDTMVNPSPRATFWEARILEILALNHPWVLVGDLNIITGQIDKFGGRSVEAGEGHHLTELMNVTGGVDLGCTGNFFTWSNGRSLPNLVKERLDRAICDPEWIIRYPKAGVKSLVIKESDHAPVMLDLLFDRERIKAPFRYLDAWSRDASCKVIIKEAWDIVVHGIKSFQLVSKLENTRRSLSKWNRTHFGMCKEKLKALNRLLLEVQQRTPSDVNLKLEADIILEMEEHRERPLSCPYQLEYLVYPLENGGLNFKKFEDMNLALVSKLGWKLAKGEESLWTRVFCAKYWENGTNLFWNPESPKSLSFGARSILASRDLIRKESCFLIANGRTTNMWHAPWIPWLDWDQFRAAFNPMIAPTTTFVSSLLNEDREWDSQQTATWMVPSVASSLHLLPMLPTNHVDRLIWKDATNGEFSSRVAYKSIIKGRIVDKDPIWSKIWKLKISERMKLFLWKLGHDILPFGERLQRIFGNELVCAICDEQEDSAVHLFCHCPLAKSLWLASPWGIRSEELNLSNPLQLTKWLLEPLPLLQQGNIEVEEFRNFGVSLCFTLWTVRNQAYHDHVQPSFFTIFNRIKCLAAELNSVLTTPLVMPMGNSTHNEVQDLLQNDFVVFVDAACKDLRSVAGIIVTKSATEFVEAFSVQLQAFSPLEAEALALHHAVQRCITLGWHNVTFAVDCQPLVYGIKSRKSEDTGLEGCRSLCAATGWSGSYPVGLNLLDSPV
ncbi:hypothetical protein F8388_009760 [Cannabis sativa]|uniref:CCHC-type domain-containing protein n=1 Tax=Cannabis sativa TaxID=3483 RepID=A0A7J6H338_CANSA|nr:hypothetical protein F8388_009760 [Cannabis sativa]